MAGIQNKLTRIVEMFILIRYKNLFEIINGLIIFGYSLKKFEPVQSLKEKKLRSGKRYSQKTSFIESTQNKKKEIDVKDKEDDIYFHGWNIR